MFGMKAKGVGVTWGPVTGEKAAEVGRPWVVGIGGAKDEATGKGRASAQDVHTDSGPVSGRKRPTSAGPPVRAVWTGEALGSEGPEYTLSQVGFLLLI